jgi:hypothetical protein
MLQLYHDQILNSYISLGVVCRSLSILQIIRMIERTQRWTPIPIIKQQRVPQCQISITIIRLTGSQHIKSLTVSALTQYLRMAKRKFHCDLMNKIQSQNFKVKSPQYKVKFKFIKVTSIRHRYFEEKLSSK